MDKKTEQMTKEIMEKRWPTHAIKECRAAGQEMLRKFWDVVKKET